MPNITSLPVGLSLRSTMLEQNRAYRVSRLSDQVELFADRFNVAADDARKAVALLWAFPDWESIVDLIDLLYELDEDATDGFQSALRFRQFEAATRHRRVQGSDWWRKPDYLVSAYRMMRQVPQDDAVYSDHQMVGIEEGGPDWLNGFDQVASLNEIVSFRTARYEENILISDGFICHCESFLENATSNWNELSTTLRIAADGPYDSIELDQALAAIFGLAPPGHGGLSELLGLVEYDDFGEIIAFQKNFEAILLRYSDVERHLASLKTDLLDQAWKNFSSIGMCAGHLPKDAIVQLSVEESDGKEIPHIDRIFLADKSALGAVRSCCGSAPMVRISEGLEEDSWLDEFETGLKDQCRGLIEVTL